MIAIVSSAVSERMAFATLCDNQGWTSVGCDSVRSVIRLLRRSAPRVLLMRHKLEDGYSDDVFAAVKAARLSEIIKTVVLVPAGTTALAEARQIAMGADCVQRDPVRIEVLLAYISKFLSVSSSPSMRTGNVAKPSLSFCRASLDILERTLCHRGRTATVTPREVALIELLTLSPGKVVTYETLYQEILGRRFRGDTSNMRVLLGKLNISVRPLGISLNRWVSVIPKTGYRYTP